MMNPGYAPLADRVRAVMPVILDHEQKTGRKVMYAFGIASADPDTMMRHHDIVAEAGGNAAVIPINAVGHGGMAFLRKRSRLVLHAHRSGWDVLTRHPDLGFDFSVYQQIWRLLGVDQFQVNGIGAKYWEPDQSFLASFHACMTPMLDEADRALPVVGSGQWGGQAPETYARNGGSIDLLYLGGGGIMGHPGGPGAGVRAIRQSWEAAVSGVPLETYAREHPELAQSIAAFGKTAPRRDPGHSPPFGRLYRRPAQVLGNLGRLQQGVDRPPVRPRGPGRGRSIKPLVGNRDDGPGDASVVQPVRGSTRGLAVACGINPRYGRLDPYAMAGCVIDEAVRNCVAVGADPYRIAILDNFCWGTPNGPRRSVRWSGPRRVSRRRAGLRYPVHLGQGQPQQRVHP